MAYPKVDLDEAWRAIGVGKYHIQQYALWSIQIFLIGVQFLTIIFIGYRPPYRCADINVTSLDPSYNENNTYIEYDKCQIQVFTGYINGTNSTLTMDCPNGHVYDQPKHTTFVTEFDLVCDRASFAELTQSLFMIGLLFGALCFPQLSDKFGRRIIFQVCCTAMFFLNMGQAFSPNILVLNVLRFFSGFFCQGTQQTYVLFLEMLPMENRYMLEVIGMSIWVSTIAILGLLGYLFREIGWRYFQIALSAGLIHAAFVHLGLDESARWLLANGKAKEAFKVIKKASRMNGKKYDDVIERARLKAIEIEHMLKQKESEEMTSPVKSDQESETKATEKNSLSENSEKCNNEHKIFLETANEQKKIVHGSDVIVTAQLSPAHDSDIQNYTVLTLLKDRRILINSLILWFIWITNEFTYFGIFLTSFTLSGDRFVNHVLLATVEYPIILIEYFLMNRFGRKILAMFFHCLTAICLLISTILSSLNDETDFYGKAILVVTLLGKFGIGGSFSVLWIYTPEMYPTNMRAVGMGTASMVSRFGGIITPFMSNFVEVVPWGPGVIFSTMCFIASASFYFLPETLGHELPTKIEELKMWHRGTLKLKDLNKTKHEKSKDNKRLDS